MARKKTPPAVELDPNIIGLVEFLNSFKGITTVGSCGGHLDPDPGQKPAGAWTVTFKLAPDEHGWRALEFLAWLANNFTRRGGAKVRLEPFASPPYLNTPGECSCSISRDGAGRTRKISPGYWSKLRSRRIPRLALNDPKAGEQPRLSVGEGV